MINKAKELNEALKNTSEAKEYFKLKEEIKQNDYLTKLLLLIKDEQKEANKCLVENDVNKYKLKKQTLKVLEEKFASHPLISNYIESKNDLYQLLEQVIAILSDN